MFNIRAPNINLALFGLGVIVALFSFGAGLQELALRWYRQPEYSHGYFIVLISLALFWQRRSVLQYRTSAPSRSGLVVVLIGSSMLVLGQLAALYLVIQLGFWLVLAGLIVLLGGVVLLRALWMPWIVLLFAIPLPYFLDAQISWRLQLLSSQLGVGLLRALGSTVYLEGNVIDLGFYKLQVVDACSGLRYLYPLTCIAFLWVYVYSAKWYWRVWVFLSAIPITVLMNSARIAGVGLLVDRWGAGMAEGFLHYFEGWVVFLASLGVLLLEVVCIERLTLRRPLSSLFLLPEYPVTPEGPRQATAGPSLLLWAVLVLSVAGGIGFMVEHRPEIIPPHQSLKTFPLVLDGWRAQDSSLPLEMEQALGFDDYVLADYRDANDAVVNFYVAYYRSQRKGVSPHSPRVCIPGGGWVIASADEVQVPGGGLGATPVMRVLIYKGKQQMLVYYWFEQRGRQLAGEYAMKWYLLRDALLKNRSDGALVRLVTPIANGESTAAADERLKQWVRRVTPLIAAYVPA